MKQLPDMSLILFRDAQCGRSTSNGFLAPALSQCYKPPWGAYSLLVSEFQVCEHGGTPMLWAGTDSPEDCARGQPMSNMCGNEGFLNADSLQWHSFTDNNTCRDICGKGFLYIKFDCYGATEPKPTTTPSHKSSGMTYMTKAPSTTVLLLATFVLVSFVTHCEIVNGSS